MVKIHCHVWFDRIVLFFILFNCIVMALEEPGLDQNSKVGCLVVVTFFGCGGDDGMVVMVCYVDILTHPVNFPVGGNRSARRKPTTFGRALTNSFHTKVRLTLRTFSCTKNRTRDLRGERRAL